RASRKGCLDRRGSAGAREGADVLFLIALCVTPGAAKSETTEDGGVWREAQERRAADVRRDCGRWGGGRQRSQDGRSTRSAPDLGTRAARIDFLSCRLYASVQFHSTLAFSRAYARAPCRWTSMRPRAAQISGKIGPALCH